MLAYVEPVAKKMAGKMKDLTDEEKIIFIRAACGRIWIDANNEIEIELSLPGLEAFARHEDEDANDPHSTSFPPPQSEPSDGSHEGAGGMTNAERHWDLSHKARCRDVEFCPSLPPVSILAKYRIRW